MKKMNVIEMYPKKDLYTIYKKNVYDKVFSNRIPDITKKRTLDVMNLAINCCEKWGNSLDVGGGSGHYSIPLLFKFKKSVVVEVSKHGEHEYLKNRYPNFEYHNDFIEQIEFKEKFDFILLADIFEHIVDVTKFIGQITNLQNDGGVMYILTPNPLFCGPAEQSGIYYTRHKDGHHKHYTKQEVIKIMNKHHYEPIYIGYEEGPLRQRVKRIVRGLSRRDKNLGDKFFVYRKIISPMLSIIYNPLLLLTEFYVYKDEYSNKNNSENMMSTTYIFKKIIN